MVVGCSAARITAERRQEAVASGHPRVIVVPANLSVALAVGLESVVEPVQEELVARLQAGGAEVAFLAVDDAVLLWNRTVGTVRSIRPDAATLEVVSGTFVRNLRTEARFDLLVMPSLGYREAHVEGDLARWDGVQRVVGARNKSSMLEERVPALSLHVQVYTPDGRLWFQRWAGLDLIYHNDLVDGPEVGPQYLERHPERLQECVTLALQPLG